MLKNRTLLVVGAGASKEFGLPVGEQLAKSISQLLYFEFEFGQLQAGDHEFLSALRRGFNSDRQIINEHLTSARQISNGIYLTSSIDNYIDTHQQDERIKTLGKASIVWEILKAERGSTLFSDRSPSRAPLDFTTIKVPEAPNQQEPWLIRLFRIVCERVPVANVAGLFSDLKIISFNYDRCIGHCLQSAVAQVYNLDEVAAKKIVDSLDIVYPYGTVTRILSASALDSVPFGTDPSELDVIKLGANIRTYTEQVSDNEITAKIENFVQTAETIVFLGFAYHPQNMDLLNLGSCRPTVRIFGTATAFSNADRDDVVTQLQRFTSANQYIEIRNDLISASLFREYRRSLSRN